MTRWKISVDKRVTDTKPGSLTVESNADVTG
jgi:hypothetical protein